MEMRVCFTLLLGAVLTALPSVLCAEPKEVSAPRKAAVVEEVIDGDTLRVRYNGERELVRLIGIDTPESRPNPRAVRQAQRSLVSEKAILELGHRATRAMTGLVGPKSRLELEFDTERRDRYGRLLAYVYLSDGRMLNEEMLRLGYAKPYTVPPNVRYEERFRTAFRQGREAQRGLWGAVGF